MAIYVRNAPGNAIPEIGLGGYNPNENEVIISFNPQFSDLEASISNHLGPTVAHELHHAKRRREIGYGSSLLEAMISEGLADCFAVEVYDIAPPIWSVYLTPAEIDDLIVTASPTWQQNGYNHSEWFFGTTSEIPRWAGYSIGFKLVKDYLDQDVNRSASGLVGHPASAFID